MRKAGLALLLLVLSPTFVKASTCAPDDPFYASSIGGTVSIEVESGTPDGNSLGDGVNQWNATCGNDDVPTIFFGDTGDIHIGVRFEGPAPVGNNCGRVLISYNSLNQITGATIYVYSQSGTTGQACDRQEDTVAHEIGHVLGLTDVSESNADSCNGRIMNLRERGADGSTFDRSVSSGDCTEVEKNWTKPALDPDHDRGDCAT